MGGGGRTLVYGGKVTVVVFIPSARRAERVDSALDCRFDSSRPLGTACCHARWHTASSKGIAERKRSFVPSLCGSGNRRASCRTDLLAGRMSPSPLGEAEAHDRHDEDHLRGVRDPAPWKRIAVARSATASRTERLVKRRVRRSAHTRRETKRWATRAPCPGTS
jgi:hypothetical protein